MTGSSGRYVLFRTGGKNWMIAPDGPAPAGCEPLPELIRPMLAVLRGDAAARTTTSWAYEMKWDGVRAVVYVEGGRPRALTRNDNDITRAYPSCASWAARSGRDRLVLDGEIVALDAHGPAELRAAAAADARHAAGAGPARWRARRR